MCCGCLFEQFSGYYLTKRPAPFHWEKCSLGSNLNHWYKEIYLVNWIFIRFSSNLILRKNNVKEYYNCLPLFFWSQTLFSITFGGTKSIRRKMPNWPTSTTLSESENSLSSSVPVESVLSPSHSFRSPLWMLAKLQLPTWYLKLVEVRPLKFLQNYFQSETFPLTFMLEMQQNTKSKVLVRATQRGARIEMMCLSKIRFAVQKLIGQ